MVSEYQMATLTIPNLDDAVHERLRARAEERGRSAEEEARDILEEAIERDERSPDAEPGSGARLVAELRAIFADMGGVDLPEFPDAPINLKSPFENEELEDK
jgi:plasmid stability protein